MDFNQETFDKICVQVATSSRALRNILKDDGMPDTYSFYKWMREDEKALKQYARAKEDQADILAEEILDIADDGLNDTYTKDGEVLTNHDVIARSRLRVDSRKWLASKLKAKKYGDRIDNVSSDGSMSPANKMSAAEIDARIKELNGKCKTD